ncbi:MAG TPA: YbaB/EbfC family nucleoid-associated protein [Dehalococcoidia bacterium]|nr:YbaB/EbfC family nucleoid-associated protein [Dehalococcoidia bacterium]
MNSFSLRQAQELQAKLVKAQEELAEATVEASSGGGAVKVTVTGQQKILSIKIAPEAINPDDAELLEDLVLTAVSEAIAKSQELAAQRLGKLTGGFKIPGLT